MPIGSTAALRPYQAVVFAVGNGIRHVPPQADADAHWQRANVEGVPRFFHRLREAGVCLAVLVGSFYPQAAPQLVAGSTYVPGCQLADEGARALSDAQVAVCSVNAPFVVGSVPGLDAPGLAAYVAYARGQLPAAPPFAMASGVNFMSTQSLSEAIAGALEQGEPGHAYLVGDKNLSFADYFGELFRAAGYEDPLPILDREHPLLPDAVLYAGRGATVYYEPDAAENVRLGYRRQDVRRTLRKLVGLAP
jgi:dihydroflavonol-4-reductase